MTGNWLTPAAFALGSLMVAAGLLFNWVGREPAWFAVTSLVWGAIIVSLTLWLAGRGKGS